MFCGLRPKAQLTSQINHLTKTVFLKYAQYKLPIDRTITIRIFCRDTFQQANSGHPGTAVAYVILQGFLRSGVLTPITRQGSCTNEPRSVSIIGGFSRDPSVGPARSTVQMASVSRSHVRLVGQWATNAHLSPLALAWTAAAVVRIAPGSATVATITGAGIVAMPEGGMDMVWTGMFLT
jgi:hypothetical protein